MLASKILIPVDGSPASLCALDYAIEMAIQNPGSSFVVLNVQNVSATELSGEFMEGVQERLLQAADKALKEAKADVKQPISRSRLLSERDQSRRRLRKSLVTRVVTTS